MIGSDLSGSEKLVEMNGSEMVLTVVSIYLDSIIQPSSGAEISYLRLFFFDSSSLRSRSFSLL